MVHSCKRSHRSPSEQALSTNPLQQYCCPVLSPRARRKKAQQTTQVFAHTDHFSLTTVTLKLAPNIDTAVSLAKHALFFTRQRPLPCFHDLVPRKASTPACLPGWEHSFPLLPKGPPHAVIHPRGRFAQRAKRRHAVYHSFKTFFPPSITLCCFAVRGRSENRGIITSTRTRQTPHTVASLTNDRKTPTTNRFREPRKKWMPD